MGNSLLVKLARNRVCQELDCVQFCLLHLIEIDCQCTLMLNAQASKIKLGITILLRVIEHGLRGHTSFIHADAS
jgi:hypothetical protein